MIKNKIKGCRRMSQDKISQAEDQVLESLNQPISYEIDGEKITNIDPETKLNVIRQIKKNRVKNPFAAIGICKIHTEGPQK